MSKQIVNSEQETPVVDRYSVLLRFTEEDGQPVYEAVFRELGQSVVAYGDTPAKALKQLYKDGRLMVSLFEEDGKEVPEPIQSQPWENFSGKITVRMPRWLHYKLYTLADEDGISLNSYIITSLSMIAEHRHCQLRPISPHSLSINSYHTTFKIAHSEKLMAELFKPKQGAWDNTPMPLNRFQEA